MKIKRNLLICAALVCICAVAAIFAVRGFTQQYSSVGASKPYSIRDYSEIVNYETQYKAIILEQDGVDLYDIIDTDDFLVLAYRDGDRCITLSERKIWDYSEDPFQGFIIDNNEYSVEDYVIRGIEGTLVTITTEIGITDRTVCWIEDDIAYECSVNGSERDLEKVIQNLKVLER